jgi:hypothetical protein
MLERWIHRRVEVGLAPTPSAAATVVWRPSAVASSIGLPDRNAALSIGELVQPSRIADVNAAARRPIGSLVSSTRTRCSAPELSVNSPYSA